MLPRALQGLTFLFLFEYIPVVRLLQLIDDALVGVIQRLRVVEEPVNSHNPYLAPTLPLSPTSQSRKQGSALALPPPLLPAPLKLLPGTQGLGNTQAKRQERRDCRA